MRAWRAATICLAVCLGLILCCRGCGMAPFVRSLIQPRLAPTFPTEEPTETGEPTPKPTLLQVEPEEEHGNEDVDRLCIADKHFTAHELAGAGPQRLEITLGEQDKGHLDYYPRPGIKSVSIQVLPGESEILAGYGSFWVFPLRDCSDYSLVEDMTNYAEKRREHGHSGLVWESLASWLAAEDPTVNLWNADPTAYRPVFWEEGETTEVIEPSAQPTECEDGVRGDHPPMVNEAWTLGGENIWVVANMWTNIQGQDQTERKIILAPGEVISFLGGGSSWSWPAECEEIALSEFAKNPHSSVTIEELSQEGLVQ